MIHLDSSFPSCFTNQYDKIAKILNTKEAKNHIMLFSHSFFLFIAKLEFALTVLKPEPEGDAPDQLFLLAPAVIQKKDIQVRACMSC